MLPQTFLTCLYSFETCFTAPGFARFVTVMAGWLLCIGKHTVTGVARAAGATDRDCGGYHRFFSRGAWSPQRVGRVVLQLALQLQPQDERVKLTLDDTLARHTGVHFSSAGLQGSTGPVDGDGALLKQTRSISSCVPPWGTRTSMPRTPPPS